MNNYQKRNKRNKNGKSTGKSKSERVGFYVALSICIVAVGLAVWSTYTSVNDYLKSSSEGDYVATLNATVPVNKDVTGVTEVIPITETQTIPATIEQETLNVVEETTEEPEETEEPTEASQSQEQLTESVLQQILQVASSLQYPVSGQTVSNMYSETAVFSKTMNDFRAHTGTDFVADKGEAVVAMCDGEIDGIYSDAMLGQCVSISSNGYSVVYCGIDKPTFKVGDKVEAGDKIGEVGVVPCEEVDASHIHIEVRVSGKPIDPLAVIASNE